MRHRHHQNSFGKCHTHRQDHAHSSLEHVLVHTTLKENSRQYPTGCQVFTCTFMEVAHSFAATRTLAKSATL